MTRLMPLATALLLLVCPLRVEALSSHHQHLRIQLVDRMQFDRSPYKRPLGYELDIHAEGPAIVIRHFVVELQGLGGWHLTPHTISSDCRGRKEGNTVFSAIARPLYLSRHAGLWDLGHVRFPAHVMDYGPVYDIPTDQRLGISPWGCDIDFTFTPQFRLTPTSAKQHRFLVRLYSGLHGHSSLLAALQWSGEYIDGPN